MKIIDLSFDKDSTGKAQGALEIDLASGVVKMVVSETNPDFNGGLTINVPLEQFRAAIEAQAPNWLVKEAEDVAINTIEDIT